MEDPVVAGDPDELAVPALLVPGAGGAATFAELPAPLGSLPELLSPPALAGPDGTPLTPAAPAPAEPALGELTTARAAGSTTEQFPCLAIEPACHAWSGRRPRSCAN